MWHIKDSILQAIYTSWREPDNKARMSVEPCFDIGVAVCAVVIHNQVQGGSSGQLSVDEA